MRKCEELYADDADEQEGQPQTQEGWQKWMNVVKDGATRAKRVDQLIVELQISMQALQLGLTSASIRRQFQPHSSSKQLSFNAAAIQKARDTVHHFEMRRSQEMLLAVGCAHCLSSSPSRARSTEWCSLGDVKVELHVPEKGEMRLVFIQHENVNDEADDAGENQERSLIVDDSFRVRRVLTVSDLPATIDGGPLRDTINDSGAVCYLLHCNSSASPTPPLLLEFECAGSQLAEVTLNTSFLVVKLRTCTLRIYLSGGSGISAEAFEALLFFFRCKGRKDNYLDTVFPHFDKTPASWRLQLEAEVGKFEDAQSRDADGAGAGADAGAAGAGAGAGAAGAGGLCSPISQLKIR